MKASVKSPAVSNWKDEPKMELIQVKILRPVGIAMIMVAAVK
jgi:hypothetical protein